MKASCLVTKLLQRGKLEGIFQGEPSVAEIAEVVVNEDDLKDRDKVSEILTKTIANQHAARLQTRGDCPGTQPL